MILTPTYLFGAMQGAWDINPNIMFGTVLGDVIIACEITPLGIVVNESD